MKSILFVIVSFLFIGCQSAGTSTEEVSQKHQLEPKMAVSVLEKKSNFLKGELQLKESDDFYADVTFNNIKISSDECKFKEVNYSSQSLKNGEVLTFSLDKSQCPPAFSKLKISFNEEAQYMDTNLKTVSKSFEKKVDIYSELNLSNELGVANIQPSDVTVEAGESHTFTVYAFDVNNSPVSVPVKINPPVDSYGKVVGEFDTYSTQTDEKGKGSFTYKAPDTLNQDSIDLTVSVTIGDVTKHIKIHLIKKSENIIKISKAMITPSDVTLHPEESYTFTVYAFDENNSPVSVPVKINPPLDSSGNLVGEFESYSIETDSNGKGTFTYKAPNSLNTDEVNLTVAVKIGDVTKNLNIHLIKETATVIKVSKAVIQPSNVTLYAGENYTFNVYAFDSDNNPISVPVKINPPLDSSGNLVGEFDNYLIKTDDKGKGSFTYTAPNSLNTDEVNLTIAVKIGDITKNLKINLKKEIKVVVNPTKLLIVPNNISISGGSQYIIKILTLDDDNRGVSSTVSIAHPIDSSNNSWGSFDKYTVTTNANGEGEVTFTAVENIDNLGSELKVPFNITSLGLKSELTLSKPDITKEIVSYDIKYNVPNSVQIEKDFSINLQIVNKKNGALIEDGHIKEINLSSENHLVYFDNNSSQFKLTITKNNMNIYTSASKISGIDIVDVNALLDDNQTVSKQIPIIVISGPVSAISINDLGSNYNSANGLFEQNYAIHAVDKYSNPVQAGTKITVGAIVNKKFTGTKGQLTPVSGSDTSEFNDSSQTFTKDLINNTLIVMADSTHTSPLYLGGWIIDNVKNSNTLTLASAFDSSSAVNNLDYIIGNEKRFNSCDNTLAVADFDSADKTYKTDNHGIAVVTLRYDPYLVGKTIALYANSYQDKRVGVSIKKILLNNDLLTLESNEDDDPNVKHNDGIWEKTGTSDDSNGTEGVIHIGTNDGPYNTVLSTSSTTTLAQNTNVTISILTPGICEFVDANGNALSSPRIVKTGCNGAINFDVNYTNDGTCKVGLSGINYEY